MCYVLYAACAVRYVHCLAVMSVEGLRYDLVCVGCFVTGLNLLLGSEPFVLVDSLSQQSSTRARAPSFVRDTKKPKINRSGSLVRAHAPSFIDTLQDSVSSLIITFGSYIMNISVHNIKSCKKRLYVNVLSHLRRQVAPRLICFRLQQIFRCVL